MAAGTTPDLLGLLGVDDQGNASFVRDTGQNGSETITWIDSLTGNQGRSKSFAQTSSSTQTGDSVVGKAARILGVQLHVLRTSTERDIDVAIANWVQLRAGPLVKSIDAYLTSRSEQIGALVLRHAIPTISPRESIAAGGLMSYGSDSKNTYRPGRCYTGRILKGDKPAGLPVQQLTKIKLIINMKTARALGITSLSPSRSQGRRRQLWVHGLPSAPS